MKGGSRNHQIKQRGGSFVVNESRFAYRKGRMYTQLKKVGGTVTGEVSRIVPLRLYVSSLKIIACFTF